MELLQRIMITRPAQQAGQLADEIMAAGGSTFLFPTLEICPSELSEQDQEKIQKISQFDIIVFISPNAVEHGLEQIQAISDLPNKIQLATIGQGSARALKKRLGKQPDICPKENFNSEGLLAMPALQNVSDKRILIIRGNGGREHLKTTLQQRGAFVEYLTVYQRQQPRFDPAQLEQYLQNNEIAVIVITSAESLSNLINMTPKTILLKLLELPLLLINKRLVAIATEAGFISKLIVSTDASDAAILETLKEYKLLTAMPRKQ